jgi:hypothetical protein
MADDGDIERNRGLVDPATAHGSTHVKSSILQWNIASGPHNPLYAGLSRKNNVNVVD